MRRLTSFVLAFTIGFFLMASPASAADQIGDISTGINQVQVLSLLVGTVLPLVVGLVTKTVTSAATKAIVLAALSAASGFLTEAMSHGGFNDAFNWMAALLTAVTTFVVAVATHYGLWQPTGLTAKAQTSLVK